MKRGGRIIFHGPLGKRSDKLIEYFQVRASLDFVHVTDACKLQP